MLLYSPGIDPFLESLSETADMVFYFDEGPDDSSEACGENLSEDDEPDHAGGLSIRWLIRRSRPWRVDPIIMELEGAEGISREVPR